MNASFCLVSKFAELRTLLLLLLFGPFIGCRWIWMAFLLFQFYLLIINIDPHWFVGNCASVCVCLYVYGSVCVCVCARSCLYLNNNYNNLCKFFVRIFENKYWQLGLIVLFEGRPGSVEWIATVWPATFTMWMKRTLWLIILFILIIMYNGVFEQMNLCFNICDVDFFVPQKKPYFLVLLLHPIEGCVVGCWLVRHNVTLLSIIHKMLILKLVVNNCVSITWSRFFSLTNFTLYRLRVTFCDMDMGFRSFAWNSLFV